MANPPTTELALAEESLLVVARPDGPFPAEECGSVPSPLAAPRRKQGRPARRSRSLRSCVAQDGPPPALRILCMAGGQHLIRIPFFSFSLRSDHRCLQHFLIGVRITRRQLGMACHEVQAGGSASTFSRGTALIWPGKLGAPRFVVPAHNLANASTLLSSELHEFFLSADMKVVRGWRADSRSLKTVPTPLFQESRHEE